MVRRISVTEQDKQELKQLYVDPQSQIDNAYDYSRVIVRKPWGHEYLMYQNDKVAVWVLYIKPGCQTSTHCHPNKKTSLVVLSGKASCATLGQGHELHAGEGLLIDKGVFHGTTALAEEGAYVMEVETPVNKRDLVRLKDRYGRVGKGYESEEEFAFDLQNYNYISLIDQHVFYNVKKKIGECSVRLLHCKEKKDMHALVPGDVITLLNGTLLDANGHVLADAGDTLVMPKDTSYISIKGDVELLVVKKNDNIVKVSDFITSFLEKENLRDVFLFPGSSNVHLVDSIGQNTRLRHFTTETEHSLTIAAQSCAKLKGELAVVVLPSGESGVGALGGIADAWVDSTPILVLSGQSQTDLTIGTSKMRQLGIQEVDVTNVVAPLTKYAVCIRDPLTIRYHLEKAVYLARSGRPGPVWLDIPTDVQGMAIDESKLMPFDAKEIAHRQNNDLSTKMEHIITALFVAKRPVILAGNGIRLAKAEEEFLGVVKKLGIPVLTSRRGADLIPEHHLLYVGRPGAYGQRAANLIVQNADLLLSIGSRLSLPQIGRNHHAFAPQAKKIIVDVDKEELGKQTINPDIAVHSDAKEFLSALLDAEIRVDTTHIKGWLEHCRQLRKRYPSPEGVVVRKHVNPYAFIQALSRQLPENTVVTIDAGNPIIFAMQAFEFKTGQRLLSATGLENHGFSLPGAIGACLGREGKEVFCICADKGFHRNVQELETLRRSNLPIKIFVLNFGGHAYLKAIQKEYFGSRFVATQHQFDIERLSKAYAIPFMRVESSENMEATLQDIIKTPGLMLVEVRMDEQQEIAPRIMLTVKQDGKWDAKPLEDMYPYLDPNTIKEHLSWRQ